MAKQAKTGQPPQPALEITPPKSMRRAGQLTSLLLVAFLGGLFYLAYVLVSESPYYMAKSGTVSYGTVYDREGDVLFDGVHALTAYPAGQFADLGNLIGDTSGQMSNTLISANLGELANYSFLFGSDLGQVALKTTLLHRANKAVWQALGKKDGAVIAYNWKTGELLTCVSKPNIDIAKGYSDLEKLPAGSLLNKAFYPTVPGSTQKVSTLIAAYQHMGVDAVNALEFNCSGSWLNANRQLIKCHKSAGHGKQTLYDAFANSCNPWFAQLIQSGKLPLSSVIESYTKMGYAVNGADAPALDMDGIRIPAASTTLTDANDFDTQWGCLGQGMTLISPFQLMLWEGAVANGTGIAVKPYLIAEKTAVDGSKTPRSGTESTGQMFTAEAAKAVRDVMTDNAKKHYSVSLGKYVCGVKSGTAQVTQDGKSYENSFLTGFCLDDRCPVAFCVMIENRVKTDISAAQITKVLLDALCGVQ